MSAKTTIENQIKKHIRLEMRDCDLTAFYEYFEQPSKTPTLEELKTEASRRAKGFRQLIEVVHTEKMN